LLQLDVTLTNYDLSAAAQVSLLNLTSMNYVYEFHEINLTSGHPAASDWKRCWWLI